MDDTVTVIAEPGGRTATAPIAHHPFEWSASPMRAEFGEGVLARLEPALGDLNRLLWLSGRRSGEGAAAKRLRAFLGDRIIVDLPDVPSHSSEDTVSRGVDIARQARIDGIVAFGGGSVSDTAKAIAIVLAEGGEIRDHANVFYPPDRYDQKVLKKPKLPIFAVPVTASAAEVTPGLGIAGRDGKKLVFWDPQVVPRMICLDPSVLADIPVAPFLATAMNAFAHCVEAHYSKVRNPVSSALALHAIRILTPTIAAVAQDPNRVDLRGEVMLGAHLSGQAISNARVGLHHAICHGLGSCGGLSHGDANTIMLPHVAAFNARVAARELAEVATAMGRDTRGMDDSGAAAQAVDAIRELQCATGAPLRLRDAGFDRTLAPRVAEMTMSDRGTYFNPILVDGPHEVQALIEAAW